MSDIAYRISQVRVIMQGVAKRAGVAPFWPHRLRITFAHTFWKQTHDLYSLQLLMGHSSPDITTHYTAFDARAEALQQMRLLGLRQADQDDQRDEADCDDDVGINARL